VTEAQPYLSFRILQLERITGLTIKRDVENPIEKAAAHSYRVAFRSLNNSNYIIIPVDSITHMDFPA